MASRWAGDNSSTIKQRNRALVLRLIFRKGTISRRELAAETGLTSGAVTKITGELIKDGIIYEVGAEQQKDLGPGRTPILLDFAPRRHGVLSMNISRNFLEAALVDLRGRTILHEHRTLSEAEGLDPERVVQLMEDVIRRLRTEAKSLDFTVHRVGIGCPGIIDTKEQNIRLSSTMSWENVPLGKMVAQAIKDVPFSIANNVKAMALAEQWFGKSAGAANLVLIYIGYGIGCGQIVEGGVYPGHHYQAGEFGHILVDEGGAECHCGKRGCLETVASTRAIVSKVQQEYSRTMDEDRVLDLILREDELVLDIMAETGWYLGKAAVNLINLLDPEVVVLAGKMVTPDSPLVRALQQLLHRRAFKVDQMARIEVSQLGQRLGLLGGAAIALERVFDELV